MSTILTTQKRANPLALDALRFAAVARRSNRVTAAQIRKLLDRRES